MKKLTPPNVDFATALASAISGIGSEAVRISHINAFADPVAIEENYASCAKAATLYAEPKIAAVGDPVVYNGLSKSQLTKLYTQYFVPENKPARRLYEAIKVSANGKCPLCGGVGHVHTLDHYLPKANFPLYSVMPVNLVPCCRDCNSEKLNAFAVVQEKQTLHPYFDHDKFFLERWVGARVIQTMPPVVEYFVMPPDHWHENEKARVHAHFSEYGLADKFSIEAAADLPETIQTRRTTMFLNTPAEFSRYLAEKGRNTALPINNWRRVMFNALAADDWFCNQLFDEA
ncbi:HNH endonuclease [Agrobacterium vitis]|uniref:HNH endonuclease n=1 Tax=Agrobacterium vitis TaxID=373 RepID=A0A368NXQ7_AGRVI|nr:HNH endonuclease signature motif containing protein [Agrobacterium vitis]KAA3506358.1 HNH endonuclease [Agrobacterium vitis]KAA3520758.1 HNH endonuclease [Agrobacterium vitis]MCF1476166.1 HNH endonuclease [Agrobacterium vitis]MUZ98513.1 HNH endonuclease [Agrobacterium vitis]MVA31208.1 HNH endonuclease [Agrobacterium vitis]